MTDTERQLKEELKERFNIKFDGIDEAEEGEESYE